MSTSQDCQDSKEKHGCIMEKEYCVECYTELHYYLVSDM
jgi:hypothetical protein